LSTALEGAQLARYIKSSAASPTKFLSTETIANGKKADPQLNPDYDKWVAHDAQVCSYLFFIALQKDLCLGLLGEDGGGTIESSMFGVGN
jgi:hypothetical protein